LNQNSFNYFYSILPYHQPRGMLKERSWINSIHLFGLVDILRCRRNNRHSNHLL